MRLIPWQSISLQGLPLLLRVQTRCGQDGRRHYAAMAQRSYDDAVGLLNKLQTPYKILQERWKAGIRIHKTANEEMRRCLDRIGYSQKDLEKLNIVHVAGTKGKGSTCAYVASILSQYQKSRGTPRNVGLFTSPHLIAVRERIRLNSDPISKELFAKYFFQVWDSLEAAATKSDVPFEKPVYFRYLTLMSYHVFLQEGVDAAVYETGVGGEYDSTNIVDHPTVTGISTLGIDHTFALGETVDKIAWHKAGIQKLDVPSLTVTQLPAAMEVIEARSKERNVKSLNVVELDPRLESVQVRPDALFQKSNASLAIALAQTVLEKLDSSFKVSPDHLPREFVDGLEQVVWRGRCEVKSEGDITWYLDGAHTADSIVVAAKWFEENCSKSFGTRVLIFNQQGHREALELLEGLFTAITAHGAIKFEHVIFCTNASQPDTLKKKSFAEKWRELDPSSENTIKVLPTIEDALEYVRQLSPSADGKEGEVQALITGSVHLVGRALGALEGVDAM